MAQAGSRAHSIKTPINARAGKRRNRDLGLHWKKVMKARLVMAAFENGGIDESRRLVNRHSIDEKGPGWVISPCLLSASAYKKRSTVVYFRAKGGAAQR